LWIGNTQGTATVLFSEILYKIEEAWTPENSEVLYETNALSFVFITRQTPYEDGVGGTPSVNVDADSLSSFFQHIDIKEVHGVRKLFGTGQVYAPKTGSNDTIDTVFSSRFIAHEWGHNLGSGDGPPSFVGLGWSEKRYYYGTRNLLFQHHYRGEPIPAVGLPWLHYYPWYGEGDSLVVDFTDSNLYDVELYDIRQPEGKIYKFRLDPEFYSSSHDAHPEQYFLFAYHAGTGLDSR